MSSKADGEPVTLDALIDDMRKKVAELSDGKLTAAAIDPAGHLFDFGYVDSLTAVSFLAYVEDRWGVTIEDVDVVEKLTTIRAIAEHVQRSR